MDSKETTVRLIDRKDAYLFDNIAADVFDHPIEADLLRAFLADGRHHMAVALQGEQLVGFASAVHYVHPDKAPQLWINEVAVAPAYQRRGFARAMMDLLFVEGRALGCAEAWVLTEQDNQTARSLYRAVGGVEAETVMVTFSLESTTLEKAAC